MLFNSVDYLFFLPVVVLVTFLIPNRVRYIWLLVASYYFYMNWNAKYALLLVGSTIVTYTSSLIIDVAKRTEKKNMKKGALITGLLLSLGILLYFKYTNFIIQIINQFFQYTGGRIKVPSYDIVLPVGISFFVFQTIGYMIDVYRGDTPVEKNILMYALFVSFFPQLVAGPIERSGNLLEQLKRPTKFDANRAKSGLLTIAYGIFLKLVIADNIASLIDPVFDSIYNQTGFGVIFASIQFAFQIYCDFNGYTLIAIGSAEILGYELNRNFDSPYMASNIRDFWRRWHISLTSWFRDYLYIPLGGSRKGTVRKYVNTLIVFLCSGLWHGAAWKYVVWGGINGILCILYDVLSPKYERISTRLHIDTGKEGYKVFQRILTFLLVDFTWIFFRANSFSQGIEVLKTIRDKFRVSDFINLNFLWYGDIKIQVIVLLSLIIMGIVDWLSYKGIQVKKMIFEQQIVARWIFYILLLAIILFWGHYGESSGQTAFIYFQF